MDVAAALALVSAAASGAATAAGQSAWQSLVALVRRDRGGSTPAVPEPDAVDPGDADSVRVLTGHLAERAHQDADFAAQLCRWAETHRALVQAEQSQVHNTVSGEARISGSVIQARDINGNISL